MSIAKEKDMARPVTQWLRKCGYIVHQESTLPSGNIPDLLAYHPVDQKFLAVELKMYVFAKAFNQALSYREYCHLTYVAYPSKRANRIMDKYGKRFCEAGIGILSVDDDSCVSVRLAAGHNTCFGQSSVLFKRFKKDIRKLNAGGKV